MPSDLVSAGGRESWRGAIGISVGHGSAPLAESVAMARAADRAGLDFISIGDSGSETFGLLGAIAQATSQIQLISGVAQWTRTPATLAHAASTVQNLSAGRYCLGIGPMPRHWSEQWHGIEHEPAGSRMRDYVAATRAALAATEAAPTDHRGPFFSTVGYPGKPMSPERPVPIHLAATRPRMTAIAAEVADGVMFNSIQPLDWLSGEGAAAIERGLAAGGRNREQFATGVIRFCGIDTDRAAAYDHARRAIAYYFSIPYFRGLLEPLGFGADLDAGEAALASGDIDGQVAAVSDALVDALALAGTPDEVAQKLRAVQEVVDYVVVAGVLGQARDDAASQTVKLIDTFAPLSRWSRAVTGHRSVGPEAGTDAPVTRPPATPGERIHRGYLDVAHGQIHYRERGAGHPVILLHQTASSSVQWERAMSRMPTGVRLIAFDTPGFGGSTGPDSSPPDGMGWYADRLGEFLDGMGIDRATIVGHHTGAMIGAELAVRRPELVDRLVLVGFVVIEDETERAGELAHIRRWQLDARGEFLDSYLLPRLAYSVTTDDPQHMQQEMIAYLEAGPDYAWAYEAVYGYRGAERLPLITAPTTCLLPRDEPANLSGWTERAAELIPGAEFRLIDGGTEVCFQHPDALARALTDCLSPTALTGES